MTAALCTPARQASAPGAMRQHGVLNLLGRACMHPVLCKITLYRPCTSAARKHAIRCTRLGACVHCPLHRKLGLLSMHSGSCSTQGLMHALLLLVMLWRVGPGLTKPHTPAAHMPAPTLKQWATLATLKQWAASQTHNLCCLPNFPSFPETAGAASEPGWKGGRS